MLPTRKGSRIHKGVDSGSNFAALRNQADLGQVAVQRKLTKRTYNDRKVRDLKGQRNIISPSISRLASHQLASSQSAGSSAASTDLSCFSSRCPAPGMQLARPDDTLDSQQAVSHPPGHPMQLRQAPEATDGCLSRMRGNPHVQFLGGEGALGSLLRGTSTGSDLPNRSSMMRSDNPPQRLIGTHQQSYLLPHPCAHLPALPLLMPSSRHLRIIRRTTPKGDCAAEPFVSPVL